MFGFRISQLDFEPQAITGPLGAAMERGLRKIGFQTRQIAMNSIRRAAGPSRPGSPPHDHNGTLRGSILYDIDKAANSVVIGPRLLPKRSRDAVSALEYTGQSVNVNQRPIRVAVRPFMQPAFGVVGRQSIPSAFENSIRKD